jgi:hypothetical protein
MRVPHDHHIYHSTHVGCSFKFILKVGVEELIVNAPLASRRAKTQTTQKVRFKQQLVVRSQSTLHRLL